MPSLHSPPAPGAHLLPLYEAQSCSLAEGRELGQLQHHTASWMGVASMSHQCLLYPHPEASNRCPAVSLKPTGVCSPDTPTASLKLVRVPHSRPLQLPCQSHRVYTGTPLGPVALVARGAGVTDFLGTVTTGKAVCSRTPPPGNCTNITHLSVKKTLIYLPWSFSLRDRLQAPPHLGSQEEPQGIKW